MKSRFVSIFVVLTIGFLLLNGTTITNIIDDRPGEMSCTKILSPEPEEQILARSVVKPSGNGPYPADSVIFDLPRLNYSSIKAKIWYPGLDGDVNSTAGPFPAIVFAPGYGGYESDYDSLLSVIASWGVICMCVGTGGSVNDRNVETQSDALNYFVERNSNSSSRFFNAIDSSNFGASGHSNGGMVAIAGSIVDTRFKTVGTVNAAGGVELRGGIANTSNLHVPLQLICGSVDPYLGSSYQYYDHSNIPMSMIEIDGAGHGYYSIHSQYLVAFFKFWLSGEYEYFEYCYGQGILNEETSGTIDFTFDIGLSAELDIDRNDVVEDDLIVCTGSFTLAPTDPPRNIIGFEWDLDGDGHFEVSSPSFTYYLSFYKPGIQRIQFRCIDSWHLIARSEKMTISTSNIPPVADAGPDISVFEDEEVYLNSSGSIDTPSDLVNLSYKWDFGDGTGSRWIEDLMIEHVYSNAGVYQITLTVKDDDGETSVSSLEVDVKNLRPTCTVISERSQFFEDEIVDLTAKWNDTSSDLPFISFHWDFGDGFSTTVWGLPDITHEYREKGTYTVDLTIEDDDGDIGSSSIDLIVNNVRPTCTATSDKQVAYEDETIHFTGTGWDTRSDMGSLRYSWEFDDGHITAWSKDPDTFHSYQNEGIYNATLLIRDDDEHLNSTSLPITVNNVVPSVIAWSDDSRVEEDRMVVFKATQLSDSVSDIENLTVTWYLGDNTIGHSKEVSFSFWESGDYELICTVTDDNGATGDHSVEISIYNIVPTANIQVDMDQVSVGQVVSFNGNGSFDTPSDLANLTYVWDLGDGNISTGIIVNHSYNQAGVYYVTLTVSDSDKTDLRTVEITVESTEMTDDDDAPPIGGDEGSYIGMVIGIVAGVLVLAAIILIIVALLVRKRRQEEMSMGSDNGSDKMDGTTPP